MHTARFFFLLENDLALLSGRSNIFRMTPSSVEHTIHVGWLNLNDLSIGAEMCLFSLHPIDATLDHIMLSFLSTYDINYSATKL